MSAKETYKSISLADYEQYCEVCGESPVVVIVTEDGAISGGDLCGVCTWGEADMIDVNQWAVGDWQGEDADYSHHFEELPDRGEEDE